MRLDGCICGPSATEHLRSCHPRPMVAPRFPGDDAEIAAAALEFCRLGSMDEFDPFPFDAAKKRLYAACEARLAPR